MSRWVPFTVYFKVKPFRGKRTETTRSLQKIAIDIYDALSTVSGLSLANPGGGQEWSRSNTNARGGFKNGCGVKPQFGNNPPQAMLTGFYDADSPNNAVYSEHTLIAGGEEYQAARAHPWILGPSEFIYNEVGTLRTAIENAIDAEYPSLDYSIFKLEYSGIHFGYGGYSLP